jgi:hypothetical protein
VEFGAAELEGRIAEVQIQALALDRAIEAVTAGGAAAPGDGGGDGPVGSVEQVVEVAVVVGEEGSGEPSQGLLVVEA